MKIPDWEAISIADRRRVDIDSWHLVTNKKRAKLLLNRGENIKWSMEYHCWIWDFSNRRNR